MREIFCTLCVVLILSIPPNAQGTTPLGGLAVALSPAGDVLVTAGDNRVLYVLDPATLEVIGRHWLGVDIVALHFNGDGSTLLLEDTDGTLHLYASTTWRPIKKMPKAQQLTVAAGAGLAAGLDPAYNGHVIRFFTMVDLAEVGRILFAKNEKVQALGLNAKGDRLAVLLESVDDTTEKKGEKAPADLKDLALEEFRLKNDGKTSVLKVFEAPRSVEIDTRKTYFSASATGCKLLFHGDIVLVVNYTNVNARIGPKGEVSLFKLENGYNYGLGFSADQSILMAGGLSDGTYTQVSELSQVRFQPDRMPGWPEYFKSFAVAPDGTAYGTTSGYRLLKIKAGGIFEKSVPVF